MPGVTPDPADEGLLQPRLALSRRSRREERAGDGPGARGSRCGNPRPHSPTRSLGDLTTDLDHRHGPRCPLLPRQHSRHRRHPPAEHRRTLGVPFDADRAGRAVQADVHPHDGNDQASTLPRPSRGVVAAGVGGVVWNRGVPLTAVAPRSVVGVVVDSVGMTRQATRGVYAGSCTRASWCSIRMPDCCPAYSAGSM